MLKLIINIQSISDIITNSSSETFCKITADNKNILEAIEDLLYPLFGTEYEYDVVLNMKNKEDIDPKQYDNYDELLEQWIEIDMPYRLNDQSVFYRKGLEAILEDNFKGQYKIVYENN